MKATKQGNTQGRKRSAERQPGAAAVAARSRRAGGASAAQAGAKADGAAAARVAKGGRAGDGAKRASRGAGERPAKGRSAGARAAGGAEPTRRRSRAPKGGAAARESGGAPEMAASSREAAPEVAPEVAPRSAEAAPVVPVGASPLVDSFASPPATMALAAPDARPLVRRAIEGALGAPARLLKRVGATAVRAREACGERLGQPLREGARALWRLSRRAARRAT
jgi:hypothetical protein